MRNYDLYIFTQSKPNKVIDKWGNISLKMPKTQKEKGAKFNF